MDLKPLRQEDYQALAEEYRRLKAKYAKIEAKRKYLKALDKETSILRWLWSKIWIPLIAVGLLGVLGGGMYWDLSKPDCFKAGQNDAKPWNPWHVHKYVRDIGYHLYEHNEYFECDNPDYNCPGFKTKEDAEAFIQKWNLSICK